MNVKSTGTAAPTAQTTRANGISAEDAATIKNAAAKLNKFLEEGPGGIFKPLNDFMKTMPSTREIISNIK